MRTQKSEDEEISSWLLYDYNVVILRVEIDR